MPYYIQNPALQGFQEGNATNRSNMGIFGGMMENYLNNAAAAARLQAQRASDLEIRRAYALQGSTPEGRIIGPTIGNKIAVELGEYLRPIANKYASNFTDWRTQGVLFDPLGEGMATYNLFGVRK